MKKTITIPVGKIMSVLAMGEGVCASAVVDKALQAVPMNPVIKAIGRGAVSTIVAMPFSFSAAYCWVSDAFDIKIGCEKDSTGKRVRDEELLEMIKDIEDNGEYLSLHGSREKS